MCHIVNNKVSSSNYHLLIVSYIYNINNAHITQKKTGKRSIPAENKIPCVARSHRRASKPTFTHIFNNHTTSGGYYIERNDLYYLANALRAAFTEDKRRARKQIIGVVHEAEAHDGALASLEGLASFDAHDLRGLAQHPGVNDGLVAAADGGAVVQDDHARLELPVHK